MYDIKHKLETNKSTVQKLIAEFNTDQSELITTRTFKLAVNSLKVLSLYNIDNLAKFMDKQNEG